MWVIIMNNFEVIRIINRMVDNTKVISINMRLSFLNDDVVIDKTDL